MIYSLDKINEMAEGDQDFVVSVITVFLEEVPEDAERLRTAVPARDYKEVYQAAHKMKPTIDLFQLGVLDTLIEVQDWGKFEQTDKNIDQQLITL